jgi:cytochrome P450
VPERWLPQGERPAEYAHDTLTASKPFSVGFHSCLGKPLAWVELHLIVARLVWAFEIGVDDADIVHFDEFPVIMLIQKEPMNLRVKVRTGEK